VANKPEEELRVSVEYNVSGKQINYALAAILGLGGYAVYPSGNSGKEVSRHDFMTLQHDVKEIKVNMKVFSTMLTEQNLKIIEKGIKK